MLMRALNSMRVASMLLSVSSAALLWMEIHGTQSTRTPLMLALVVAILFKNWGRLYIGQAVRTSLPTTGEEQP